MLSKKQNLTFRLKLLFTISFTAQKLKNLNFIFSFHENLFWHFLSLFDFPFQQNPLFFDAEIDYATIEILSEVFDYYDDY